MPSSAAVSPLILAVGPAAAVETDVLVFPIFEGEALSSGDLRAADEATGGALGRALASGEIRGRLYDVHITPVTSGWRAGRLALVGAGKRAEYTTERVRRVATAVALHARHRRVTRLAWLDRGDVNPAAAAQAAAEGLILANFSGDLHKSGERSAPPLAQLAIVVTGTDRAVVEPAVERGRILGESSNIARELCNEPANLLTPTLFADRASDICSAVGIGVEILGEREIAKLGMGLLLGVARGSVEPPRVIVLRHDPPGAPKSPVLGLVGKGVTFDTGGISIKPADGMERMKDDMAGGAAVICAMRAIALLKAPIRVIGIVPSTENMPGGRAVKPGDVLTSASGKTVEVINTDAEGRLVLGDGLWYVRTLGATHLVDVATLTGACVVALGKAASAIFGQPESWVEIVRATGQQAGDRLWPMPLYEEYADQLRSEIADIINSSGRPAGACTAAMFLKEFVGDMPWAHLDVAGTAWAEESKPWQPKGASGVAVRTLAELALTSAQWK